MQVKIVMRTGGPQAGAQGAVRRDPAGNHKMMASGRICRMRRGEFQHRMGAPIFEAVEHGHLEAGTQIIDIFIAQRLQFFGLLTQGGFQSGKGEVTLGVGLFGVKQRPRQGEPRAIAMRRAGFNFWTAGIAEAQ